MRLIDVETFRLRTFVGKNIPPYAILSHTWGPDNEEVSFQDITTGKFESRGDGTRKLKGCCLQAKRDGFAYAWIDTCCINKDSSTELSEAINSMFRWYAEAGMCYAYLTDVSPGNDHRDGLSSFFASRWFRRGWTLQELLAPEEVRFFDSDWGLIGTKEDYSHEIELITGIPRHFLLGWDDFRQASVAQRMSWAACRETTRIEDMAYCLLGIFDITMPMIYGEGDRAFRRLQHEIIRACLDHSILAWGLGLDEFGPSDGSTDVASAGAMAKTPAEFAKCGNLVTRKTSNSLSAIELVAGGCLSVHLFLYTSETGNLYGLLNCGPENNSHQVAGVPLCKVAATTESNEYFRLPTTCSLILDSPPSTYSLEPIRLQLEPQSRAPKATSRRCWLSIYGYKKIGLELESVWPLVFWEKGRAMIAKDIGNALAPSFCVVRFRAKSESEEAQDLVVILGMEPTTNEPQETMFGLRVMALSRTIMVPLRQLPTLLPYFHDETLFDHHVATIGNLCVRVAVETRLVAQEPVFVMRLAQDRGPPKPSLWADKALQFALDMTGFIHALMEEEIFLYSFKRVHQRKDAVATHLAEVTTQLSDVQQQLEKLQAKKKNLSEARDIAQALLEIREVWLVQERQELDLVSARVSLLQHRIEQAAWVENDQWFGNLVKRQLELGDLNLEPQDKQVFGIKQVGGTEGIPPLTWAAITGCKTIGRLLLEKGADVEIKIAGGWTPLLLAAYKGRCEFVKLLLDQGADSQATNEEGATALQCAQDQQHGDIVELLEARGQQAAVSLATASGNHEGEPNLKEQNEKTDTWRQPHGLDSSAEMGATLISQVRSLQALLAERDLELKKREPSR